MDTQDIVEVTVGQRTEASLAGEQSVVASYAGMGTRHLAIVADGSYAPVVTRMAPRTAVSALTARVRTSVMVTAREKLEEAFADAHLAIRRNAEGTHAHERAGTAALVVLVDARGVTCARIGGGRAWVVVDGRATPLFQEAATGYVGDQKSSPQFAVHAGPLPRGARIVLTSDATARPVFADIGALAAGGAPQLAAVHVVDAARRRGQRDALACLVLQLETNLERRVHPSIAAMGRQAPERLETGFGEAPTRRRRWRKRTMDDDEDGSRGYWAWLVLAVALGSVTAFLTRPWEQFGVVVVDRRADQAEVSGAGPATSDAEVRRGEIVMDVADEVETADVGPEPIAEAPAWEPRTRSDRELVAAFGKRSPKRSAKALKRWLAGRFRRIGYPAYDEISEYARAHPDPHVVRTLAQLLKGDPPWRTRRWLSKLLPELYEQQVGGADAEP